MKQSIRFEMPLPAARRQKLGELAREAGMSIADLVRLGIGLVLQRRAALLEPERGAE